jgi:hypothetical protein
MTNDERMTKHEWRDPVHWIVPQAQARLALEFVRSLVLSFLQPVIS